jgi:hypothetical protein
LQLSPPGAVQHEDPPVQRVSYGRNTRHHVHLRCRLAERRAIEARDSLGVFVLVAKLSFKALQVAPTIPALRHQHARECQLAGQRPVRPRRLGSVANTLGVPEMGTVGRAAKGCAARLLGWPSCGTFSRNRCVIRELL